MVSCLYASTNPLIKYQDEYVHSLQHTPSCASNCPRTQRNPITCPKKTCISNLENGSGVDVSEDTGEDTVNFICYLQTISCLYISDVVFENGHPRGSRHVPRFNAGHMNTSPKETTATDVCVMGIALLVVEGEILRNDTRVSL